MSTGRYREAKKEADEAFKEGKNEEAVKLYTTAIEQNAANGTSPKHVLLSNRSAAYAKLKKWDKAPRAGAGARRGM
ncbi:hypothetical protein T484DRAFT_1878546 [Baffinella frigidus]|nr:hypothetical protein T484DRAFT_1878546 [Cryptophyta sp. CCMP2293]